MKAWGGGKMIIHGDPKGGILGMHGHLQEAMTAEDRENWAAYQEDLKDQKRWVEATKQSVAIKKKELEKAEKDAKDENSAGGKNITDAEQKVIDTKKAELAKYEGMKKTMDKATPEMFFTGNEMISNIMKDTLIYQQYQKQQQ